MPDALVRIVFQDTGAESGVNRVAKALQRLERNEPNLALRQTRVAMEELAAQATGLDPRLSRIASTLSMFGIGGAIGIAAVGGFAAIALEVKTLIGLSDELDKKLLKLNTSIASGPAATLFKAQAFGARAEELKSAGILEQLFTGFREGTGLDAIGAVMERGRESERATSLTGEALATRERSKQHEAILEAGTRKENERLLAIANATRALDETKMASSNAALALFDFKAKGELLKIALSNLDEPTKKRIEHLTNERIALERANLLAAQRAESLSHVLTAGGAGQRGNAGLAAVQAALTDSPVNDIGIMAGPQAANRPGRNPAVAGGKINLSALIGSSFNTLGQLAQGDVGGTIGGLGGIAGAFSGLKGLSFLGPVGAVLGGLGGILGALFGGGKKIEVMIDGYSSKALTQQQQLMLALTGFKGLNVELLSAGGDVRRIAYELGRQARTNGSTRIPPGAI